MSRTTSQIYSSSEATSGQPKIGDFIELTKPRLSLMSVITAVLGYFAAGPELNAGVFISLVGGTAFAAFGCGVLNQWWEREADAKMYRTKDRPIAAGRISPSVALIFGASLSILGCAWLWGGVNQMASILTIATVFLYLLAYTPMKRRSVWATEIGAIPGALPPLIGWIAAGAGFSVMGWVLFALLFAWQIPHFMAISWNCREDYEKGGFKMLSIIDPSGKRVAIKGLLWTLLLIAISFYPIRLPEVNWLVGITGLVLGIYLLIPAWKFAFGQNPNFNARKLFIATLVYLPVYLSALVADRFFI